MCLLIDIAKFKYRAGYLFITMLLLLLLYYYVMLKLEIAMNLFNKFLTDRIYTLK